MKLRFFLLWLAVQMACCVHAQYGNTIYIPQNSAAPVVESIKDMAFWMQKATGKAFNVQEGSPAAVQGIWLQTVSQSDLPVDKKQQLTKDGQSFYLEINEGASARIVGSGTNSFINGIYTLLQELGFRWYMPGDDWAVLPRLSAVRLAIKKVYTPDFQNRSYAGTGGIAAIAGLDPENTFKKDFLLWNRRNRLSGDLQPRGHSGQVFFKDMQKELESHPEYFCNNKVNRFGRIDISNAAAVQLFTTWAVNTINRRNKIPTIDVDPADGSGGKDDCLPSGMPGIETWSDKYFWLANKAAEKAAAIDPKIQVVLYAYSSHAAPPNFELEESVYPIIIPYAFQNVADPKRFMELWQKKMDGRPMGIYDYWNITQWSSDVPQFNIYSIPEKLRAWKKHNISTIMLESTNAKGPMGHAFWLATQLMWYTERSFDDLYQEFLSQCFGPAATDIKRMYDRWSLNYQGGMEVVLSFNDLNLASSKTSDPLIQKRIAELKAYVYYLKLFYDYQNEETVNRYQELIDYVYSIHHLRLLQTFALTTRYIKPPAGFKNEANKKVVAGQNAKIQNASFEMIEKKAKQMLEEAPAVYSISKHRFDISNAHPAGNGSRKQYNPLHMNGRNNYLFHLASAQKVQLQVGSNNNTDLVIKDDKQKIWFEKMIPATKDGYEAIEVSLPAGNYTLSFGDLYRFSRIVFPATIAFFSTDKYYDNGGYPLLYIYIPKDATDIVYNDDKGPGLGKRGDWINPDGAHVKPALLQYHTYRVPVPPQYRGKVWIFNIGHRSFEFLNIPKLFSLNNFKYKE